MCSDTTIPVTATCIAYLLTHLQFGKLYGKEPSFVPIQIATHKNYSYFPITCRDFSALKNIQTSSLAHPASYSMWGSVLGCMRPRHGTDHSPLCRAEVKNERSYISNASHAFTMYIEQFHISAT